MKGKPVHYEEVKQKRTIMLTPSIWEKAKGIAKDRKMSVSVYIEELIRAEGT